jgi:hypothetical protein
MGLDQKGQIVFRVSRGANGQWDVSEQGFEKALASFDSETDARSYADDLAKTKEGSRVVVEGRELSGRLGLPGRNKH